MRRDVNILRDGRKMVISVCPKMRASVNRVFEIRSIGSDYSSEKHFSRFCVGFVEQAKVAFGELQYGGGRFIMATAKVSGNFAAPGR